MEDLTVKHFALVLIAAVLLLAGPAEARGRRAAAAPPECNVIMPCDFGMSIFSPSKVVEKIDKRNRNAKTDAFISNPIQRVGIPVFTAAGPGIARPGRYIAGRLICAINVGSALAERGLRGTGSALALSYLRWGVASGPVPGAVAVSHRRGGGHVAIVSRVEADGTVIVWNPSPRGRGWQEVVNRHRAVYRTPG